MVIIKNKKILLIILGGIVLVILWMVTFLLTARPENPTVALPTPLPTPTNIPLPPSAYLNTSITSFEPANGNDNISLFATVSATFSRPLTPAEQQHVSLTSSPSTDGSTSWSSDKTTISFTPSRFTTNTLYTISISFGSITNSWTFTTVPDTSLSQEDKNALQLQSDNNFGAWQNQLYSSYPWYDHLPLQSDQYFTFFDINTRQFITDIYTDPNNTDTIRAIKQEVVGKLQSLGIDTSKYLFVWNTN